MKKLLIPVILMLAACDYEVPLSETPSAPVNPALVGSWTQTSDDKSEKPALMKIEISGSEYSITYTPEGDEPLLFKGFHIRVAELDMIQLEWLNPGESKSKYLFVKYELTSDGLMYYLLNDIVSNKCKTTEELRDDLKAHRKNPALFTEPRKFTKLVPQ